MQMSEGAVPLTATRCWLHNVFCQAKDWLVQNTKSVSLFSHKTSWFNEVISVPLSWRLKETGSQMHAHPGHLSWYQLPTVTNLTAPDGLQRTIWEVVVGKCLEKGRHFQQIFGRWLGKPSVLVFIMGEPIRSIITYWSQEEEWTHPEFLNFPSRKVVQCSSLLFVRKHAWNLANPVALQG